MSSGKSVAVKVPRKLIEVALPLDKINAAAAHEKMPGIGAHPRGIHLWWARRPLAAARAVLFAQFVNDPGYERHMNRGVNKLDAANERDRLFAIIEDLVKWENTNNEDVLSRARAEIWRSWRETCDLNRNHPDAAILFNREKLPGFHDPFAGGGAIPLEAQRLGLDTVASDLNPVAVTINKAMIEIPPRFTGQSPVGPGRPADGNRALRRRDWPGINGLAEDIRRYGAWIGVEAENRIGSLFPRIEITQEIADRRPDLRRLVGQNLLVLTWLWARTVKSPNPAYSHADVPLVSSYILSSRPGKETYVEPVIERDNYHFEVRIGKPKEAAFSGTTAGKRHAFLCMLSGTPMDYDYIREQGKAGKMGQKLFAIVADSLQGRVYLSPDDHQSLAALQARPRWIPDLALPDNPRDFKTPNYGLRSFGDLFTPRQLVALDCYSELLSEAVKLCQQDAIRSGMSDGGTLEDGGNGAIAYSQAIGVYLAFAIDRLTDYGSTIATWKPSGEQVMQTYKRQAIPMTWDFPESNFLADRSISWSNAVKYEADNLLSVGASEKFGIGTAVQADAQAQTLSQSKVVSTDPPYYDNIGYADLSDFFYVWLRRNLREIFPSLFSTIAVPKQDELVASPYRHGSKAEADDFFLNGMTKALGRLYDLCHPGFPLTVYYAFKQTDGGDEDAVSSPGWVTFLDAVLKSGFAITGTWPMRTELSNRMIGAGNNVLASSIVLVCRKRDEVSSTVSRSQFLRELRIALPDALTDMTRGGEHSPVAPVDLSQAIVGPGMAIFSRYRAVLEADGTPMSIKTALQLINRFLADDDFDPETQFCVQWFENNYWKPGAYGQADVAARAKGTSADAIARSGVLTSGGGQVQLKRPSELVDHWLPDRGNQTPVWEALHHLIHAFNEQGEQAAGQLLARVPALSGPMRTLSYRLYTLCERKGLADDARAYNELISSWAAIEVAAQEAGYVETQADLFQS